MLAIWAIQSIITLGAAAIFMGAHFELTDFVLDGARTRKGGMCAHKKKKEKGLSK